MDIFAFPPIAALLDGTYQLLMLLTGLLTPIAGGLAAALAVIVLTLLVRAALIPTGVAQAKGEQTRSRLAPKLALLQKRYGKNPEKLQRETMKLYQTEKTSPFAGCLPMLAQAPVVGLLYSVFLHQQIAGHPNELLTNELFGVPLGTSLVGAIVQGTATWQTFVVVGVIALLIALVGELTRRAFRPQAPAASTDSGTPAVPQGLTRALGLLQFVTAVVALFVPVAAGLYLVVTVAWTLVQRILLRRRYPLEPVSQPAA